VIIMTYITVELEMNEAEKTARKQYI